METPTSLAEAALLAKRYIGDGRASSPCKFRWRSLPEPGVNPPVNAAVDGGSRRIETETRTYYVIKSWGGVFTPSLSMEKHYAGAGFITPPIHAEERIAIYREILEAYTALQVLPDKGLLLMDGSIRPVVKWWRPGFGGTGPRMRVALERALEGVEEWVRTSSDPLAESIRRCRRLGEPPCMERLIQDSRVRPASAVYAMSHKPMDGEWIVLLEVTEKLYLYMQVLREAWSRGVKPVFITKTSRQTSLCKGSHPDVYYIRRMEPRRPGYTVWEESTSIGGYEITGLGREDLGQLYPDVAGIRRFYEEEIAVVEAYARLAPGAPILLVGIVVPAQDAPSSLGEAEDLVASLLEGLASIPGRGYPAPLFIAHQRARVDRGELPPLERILGIDLEPRERAMLEY